MIQVLDLTQRKLANIWRSDPCAILFELAKRFPGACVFLDFGPARILVVQDRATARHVLHGNGENYKKSFGALQAFFGESRLTTDGERWQYLRRLSQPFLTKVPPERLAEVANHYFSHAATELLRQSGDGGLVAVDETLNAAAAGIVSEAAFGFDIAELGEDLLSDFRAILTHSSSVAWDFERTTTPRSADDDRLATTAKAQLRHAVQRATREHQVNPEATDLLSLLDREGDKVDLVGEISTLLFAGFDTSAAALGWSLFLLANDPDLQDRLRKCVTATVGDRPTTMADFGGLAEVIAFQNEALRIFPPIPLLSRVSVGQDNLSGEPIAAGQRVLLSVIGLHHDSAWFPSPATVDLSRFPSGGVPRELDGQFVPFGGGSRSCGGSRFAAVELTIGIVTMLQRLKFGLGNQEPLLFDWQASLRRRGGQHFRVEPAL